MNAATPQKAVTNSRVGIQSAARAEPSGNLCQGQPLKYFSKLPQLNKQQTKGPNPNRALILDVQDLQHLEEPEVCF